MAAPEFVDFTPPTAFAENTVNAAPQLLFGTVTVTDADEDFDGGSIRVAGLRPEDTISLLNVGNGPGEVAYDSGTGEVRIGGVVIGVLSGGAGTDLVVTFNAAATAASVSAVLMSLTYANSSDTPTTARTLSLTVTDAAGEVALVGGTEGFTELTGADSPFGSGRIGGWLSPTFADIDGDGDLDAAVGTNSGGVLYLENIGTATDPRFVQRLGADNPFGDINRAYVTTRFADIDGDGDQDLFVGTVDNEYRFYRNDGAAGFTSVTGPGNPLAGIVADYTHAPIFGDLDGDGDQDLIIPDYYGEATWYRNDGSTTAPAFVEAGVIADVALGADTVGGPQRAVLVDFDGDGDLDIVSPEAFGGKMRYFENVGDATTPVFERKTGADNPFDGFTLNPVTGPALVDLDNDGVLDLVLGYANGEMRAWRYQTGEDVLPRFKLRVTPELELQTGTAASETLQGTAIGDMLVGEAGDDILKGGVGDDTLAGGDDNDSLRGEDGFDTLYGDGGDDVLVGGDGEDWLFGDAGNDVLKGGAGRDTLSGGAGDDTYHADADDMDFINEAPNDGVDTVIYKGAVGKALGPHLENLSLMTAGDIWLSGNALNNVITAIAGNNEISGLDGDDTLDGGAGDDTLRGGAGIDRLIGGAGNDTLNGDADADTLEGGAGNDILNGGAGVDIMTGGGGNDTYYIDESPSQLAYPRFGAPRDQVVEAANGGFDTVHVAAGIQNFLAIDNVEVFVFAGFTTVHTHAGGPVPYVATGDTTYIASDLGLIVLDAAGGDDVLQGGAGNDRLDGGPGNDTLHGGGGDDRLYGEDGNDIFDGGDGSDILYGGGGVDRAWGGAGGDLFNGGSGNDILHGEGGGDTLRGDTGNDILYGGGDRDGLFGGADNDRLYGEDGNDQLFGDYGADTLEGGAGNDQLEGSEGSDRLSGGGGADMFTFTPEDVRLSSFGQTPQKDTILDFSVAEGDYIDLSRIDAITGGGNDAFTFVARFTQQAGQATLTYLAASDVTLLRLDVDGDGKVDHQIQINGEITIADTAGWWL